MPMKLLCLTDLCFLNSCSPLKLENPKENKRELGDDMKIPRARLIENIRDKLYDTSTMSAGMLLQASSQALETRHRSDPSLWRKYSARFQTLLPDYTMTGISQMLFTFIKASQNSPEAIKEVKEHLLEEHQLKRHSSPNEVSLWSIASTADIVLLLKALSITNSLDKELSQIFSLELTQRIHLLLPSEIQIIFASVLRHSDSPLSKNTSLLFSLIHRIREALNQDPFVDSNTLASLLASITRLVPVSPQISSSGHLTWSREGIDLSPTEQKNYSEGLWALLRAIEGNMMKLQTSHLVSIIRCMETLTSTNGRHLDIMAQVDISNPLPVQDINSNSATGTFLKKSIALLGDRAIGGGDSPTASSLVHVLQFALSCPALQESNHILSLLAYISSRSYSLDTQSLVSVLSKVKSYGDESQLLFPINEEEEQALSFVIESNGAEEQALARPITAPVSTEETRITNNKKENDRQLLTTCIDTIISNLDRHLYDFTDEELARIDSCLTQIDSKRYAQWTSSSRINRLRKIS